MPWTRLIEGFPEDHGIFKVRDDVCADDSGRPFRRVVVDSGDWVGVIARVNSSSKKIAVIRQFRFGRWQDSLEFPGGMVDRGEDPQTAALRELREEIGMSPQKIVKLGEVLPNPAFMTNVMHVYLADDCVVDSRGVDPDEDENIQLTWIPEDEVDRMVGTSINHGLMIAAWHLLRRYEKGI